MSKRMGNGEQELKAESAGAASTFWLDRPTLVTGATGLIGGRLVKRLLEAGADVVCLVRDWVPQSVFVSDGLVNRVKMVRGDVNDQALMERTLGEYEVDTSPIATPSRPSRRTSRERGRFWKRAAAAPSSNRSSSPRPTKLTAITKSCPTRRTRRCKGVTPTT